MPSKTPASNTTSATMTSNELPMFDPTASIPIPPTSSAMTVAEKGGKLGGVAQLPPFLQERLALNEYRGKPQRFATAQLLNHYKNYGLWLDEEDILRAEFSGFGDGEMTTHKFGQGKDATEKKGILFKSINFAIIANSPRYIEEYVDGKVKIKGILCDKYGNNFDHTLWEYHDSNRKSTTIKTNVRSYYLIMLFEQETDGGWETIHTHPLCLSVKNSAAKAFGDALQDVRLSLSHEIGQMYDIESDFCQYLTRMSFTTKEMGGEQQSLVCVPEVNQQDKDPVLYSFYPGRGDEEAREWHSYVTTIRKQNGDFADKFMRQLQAEVSSLEYFPVDGNGSVTPATPLTPNTACGLGTVDATYTLDDSSVPF